jgi:hypothetical protein
MLPHRPIRSDYRYALERTDSFIKVWFWGRDSDSTPAEVANGEDSEDSIDTDNWVRRMLFSWESYNNSLNHKKGTPDAYFPSTQCDIGARFGPANIIINIDLCENPLGSLRSCP